MKKLIFGFIIILCFQQISFGEELEWWEENYPLKSAPVFIQELNGMEVGEIMRVRLLVKIAPIVEMYRDFSVFISQLRGGETICYYEIDRQHFLYNIILEYSSGDENSFTIYGLTTPEWDTSNPELVLGYGFGNAGFRELFIRFDKLPEGLSFWINCYRDVEVNDFMRVTRASRLIELDWDAYNKEYGYTWQ